MKKIFVLNYSSNSYQKERVKKAVLERNAEIINDFSKRPRGWLDKRRKRKELLMEQSDFNFMKSSEEIWYIVGFKHFIDFYEKGEAYAKLSGRPIRYFSICHQGKYRGQMREVKENHWRLK
jgi:hypothetical protein